MAMDCNIVKAQVMHECVRPILDFESRTSKHTTNSIGDGLMRSLNRSILVRTGRSSMLNGITGLFKSANYFITSSHITTHVETNILVGDVGTQTMRSEPFVDELDRRLLGGKTFTVNGTSMVIGDETVACLTILASKTRDAGRIGTTLNDETKVDREALIR